MKSSFENTKIDLEAARKKCTDLETEITAKKKEKDLMMVTHFKLIKSNEKISSELEFCKKELQRMKYLLCLLLFLLRHLDHLKSPAKIKSVLWLRSWRSKRCKLYLTWNKAIV